MNSDESNAVPYQRARFATQLPGGWLYTRSHFWLAAMGRDSWRVGLTKFGSRMLGEMVDHGFEVTPGAPVHSAQVIGWVEGFKGVAELCSVAEGTFLGPNPALDENLTLVNQDPYGAGWLYEIQGQPDESCVDVHGYTRILDQIIDQMLASQH